MTEEFKESRNYDEYNFNLLQNIKDINKYKVSFFYNDEIKKSYTYITVATIVDENDTIKENVDEINDKDIQDIQDIQQNNENKNHHQCETDSNIGINIYEYEYVKTDLINLLDACRNDFDDSDSLVDASDDIACGGDAASAPNNNIENNISINIKKDNVDKPKLNFHKIKNIVQKSEKETSSFKNASLHKKLNNIVKKITKKIKVQFTKDIISYGSILETYSSGIKNNNDDILTAFYHLILNKITSVA